MWSRQALAIGGRKGKERKERGRLQLGIRHSRRRYRVRVVYKKGHRLLPVCRQGLGRSAAHRFCKALCGALQRAGQPMRCEFARLGCSGAVPKYLQQAALLVLQEQGKDRVADTASPGFARAREGCAGRCQQAQGGLELWFWQLR